MPVNIFFCYAPEDEPHLNTLKAHLSARQNQGLIHMWDDRDIKAGTDREQAINHHLNIARIILLLVSPDFIASEYITNVVLEQALARLKSGEARVIPIVLRPTDWKGAPFGKLQALPGNGKPITTSSNPEDAFLGVAEGIGSVVEDFLAADVTFDGNVQEVAETVTAISEKRPPTNLETIQQRRLYNSLWKWSGPEQTSPVFSKGVKNDHTARTDR